MPDTPSRTATQLYALLEALEATSWAPGDDASALTTRAQAGAGTAGRCGEASWRPGLFAVAVLAADAVRQQSHDESWARVAALAAEWDLADGALYAAKAHGVIWNRFCDRAALDQAVHWAGFAAALAARAGWKKAACAYQHALLLSQRAAAGDGPAGDLDLAIGILKAVARQVPGDYRCQYRLASTLLTRYRTARRADGDLGDAVTAAQRALEAGPRDEQWRVACAQVLADARMTRWKSSARHDDDLDLALQDIESELAAQPDEANLLTAAVRVLRQRSGPGDLQRAADYGQRLAARLDRGDPDGSDHAHVLARLEADLFDQTGDPAHLDRGILFAQRSASPRDDQARIQQRENVLAWLLAARAGSRRAQPGDGARAAFLARKTESSPIPEVAVSSIRARSLACLADGDWAGAARSADRALGLLGELAGAAGPGSVEDWLSLTQGLAAIGAYSLVRQGDAGGAALLCERGAAVIAARRHASDAARLAGGSSPPDLGVPAGSALVQLAVTPAGTVALVTRSGQATFSVDLPAITDEKVAQWDIRARRPGDRTRPARSRDLGCTDRAAAQAVLSEMATALQPLCECLGPARVRLVPAGPIAGLPVSAVIEETTGAQVSVAGSAALHTRAAAAARLSARPVRTLAATSPSPSNRSPFGIWPPLPGATREGKWLARSKACAVTHLDGPHATRAEVLAALSKDPDLVHFGTHGHFDADNPLRGALYLANGPAGTAETLSPADLAPARPAAVVLACCTLAGTGRRLPDEHQGFNSVLLSAGTWFVLSPLWPVDDTATTELVTAFYQRLFDGTDPAAAMLAARALTRERYASQSPCWASWVLAGG
jgi:CHAT domain